MSPIKIAVWSAIIEPGKEFHCIVPRDFTITNAALGENLADPTGRSVVKLTHEVVPEKALRRPDDFDESDEEEEEEEDEQEGLESRTVVLTSLTAGKTEQSVLNLTFTEEDEIIITVTGQNVVHLSGNYLDQEPGADQDPDSDSDYDDDYPEEWSDEEDMDEDMEADESTATISEIPEKKSAKRTAAAAELSAPAPAADAPLTKTEKKKLAKKLKTESGAAAPAPVVEEKKAAPVVEEKKAAPAEKKAKKGPVTHPNGLIVEDSKLGSGVAAKSGKKVGMRYIGKLGNGKVFDSNTNGKPFVFNLGRGEVIKGWDQGVAGMLIGGERKLTIPAALAYGNKALPGIPKNSTLHFEVKLVSVN